MRNYRSNRGLIDMPSQMFYKGQMVGAANRPAGRLMNNINAALQDPQRFGGMAIRGDQRQFFFDVAGMAIREENGSSWSNSNGLAAVVSFATFLVRTAGVLQRKSASFRCTSMTCTRSARRFEMPTSTVSR